MPTLDQLARPPLPSIVNTLEFVTAPRRFTARHGRRYGHAYRLTGSLGDMVFTTCPEHARRVFAADSEALSGFASSVIEALVGRRSILLTSGPRHKRQRKLLTPPLHGARLRAFGQSMQRLADQHVDALRPGDTLRALDLTSAFTLDVIIQTVFGVTEAGEARELRGLIEAFMHTVSPIALFVPRLQSRWFAPWRRFTEAKGRFERWVDAKVSARRQSGQRGDDVLSLLLEARHDDGSEMDEAEVRDQLITLLLAGHETTAVALALCMSRLVRHPEALAKLQGELDAQPDNEALLRLPYLSAFIDETLRLEPLLTDIARVPTAEFALDEELVVTPRQVIIVLIEGIHQDPQLYPEPQLFRPERFLERKYGPHEFAPFGGGVRRCIGAAFSDYETKLMLATLIRKVALSPLRKQPDPRVRRNITMGPKYGVPLRVDHLRS
jgi:cytochrome P450